MVNNKYLILRVQNYDFFLTSQVFFSFFQKNAISLPYRKQKRMVIEDYKKHTDAVFSPNLFWEYDMSHFDWLEMAVVVTQRVVERGWPDDFYAAINLYGLDSFVAAIKEIPYLNDRDINYVCLKFQLKKEDLKCYTRKQSRQQRWNS